MIYKVFRFSFLKNPRKSENLSAAKKPESLSRLNEVGLIWKMERLRSLIKSEDIRWEYYDSSYPPDIFFHSDTSRW